jgi:hypothetical protein
VRVVPDDNRLGAIAKWCAARRVLAVERAAQSAMGVLADLLEVLLGHNSHEPGADVLGVEPSRRLDRELAMRAHAVPNPTEILLIPREAGEVERDEHIPFRDALDQPE